MWRGAIVASALLACPEAPSSQCFSLSIPVLLHHCTAPRSLIHRKKCSTARSQKLRCIELTIELRLLFPSRSSSAAPLDLLQSSHHATCHFITCVGQRTRKTVRPSIHREQDRHVLPRHNPGRHIYGCRSAEAVAVLRNRYGKLTLSQAAM